MKIAILTLNPGIDRIIYLDTPTRIGTLNRASRNVISQGSKGANVSIVLKTLGADPDYYSFTGGVLGGLLEEFTEKCGVRSHFVKTACGVRTNTKIIDSGGLCTEFNEAGGPILPGELEALLGRLFSGDYDIAVINGSIPQGVEKCVYNRIIKHFNAKGAFTVLDTDGEALRHGLDARPALIKPNLRELAGILGIGEEALDSEEKVLSGCRELRKKYGCDIICTMEQRGSVFCGSEGEYYVGTAQVPLCGFSGAGDTYLAAYLYKRYVARVDPAASLAYAAAAAGAKVALPGTGLPTALQIEEIYKAGITVRPAK